MGGGKAKFYAVARGRKPGIYELWHETEVQVKGYKNAKFKSFKNKDDAEKYMEANTPKTREREESDDVVTGQKKRLKIARLSQKINHNCSTSFTARSNAITGTSEHATSGSGIKAARDSSSLEVQLSFDGGSRGNPGISGAGSEIIVLEKIATKIQQQQNQLQERQQEQQQEFNNISRKKIKIRKFVGFNATNNIAEYQGLICGLQKASEIVSEFIRSGHQHPPSPSLLQPLSSSSLQHPHDHKQKEDAIAALNESIKVFVRGDSDLIIQQMKGEYKCKSALLKPLYKDAKDIIEKMKREIIESNKAQNKRQRQLDVVFDHIYRNQNSVADSLANEAMDARKSWTTTDAEEVEDV